MKIAKAIPMNAVTSQDVLMVDVKRQDTKAAKYLQQLEGSVIGRLRDQGIAAKVLSYRFNQNENFDLKLIIELADIDYVSSEMRFWIGAFAGQGELVTLVELVDDEGDLLGQSVIKGKSSGGTGYSGNTFQAAEEVAKSIVNFVSNNNNETNKNDE